VKSAPNVTILGDSRVFDTYFTGPGYRVRYGYDASFPHLWRKAVLQDPAAGYDVVHIPDHFRGGTVQNNIIRLALTNPSIVVLVDGIWDSLINKGHFLQFAEEQVRAFSRTQTEPLDLRYSPTTLVDLFKNNRLSVSPQAFAHRIQQLVSYFRRRRRQVILCSLPVPPKSYVGSTYHAGNYSPIDGWDECLRALNSAIRPIAEAYDARYLDLTALMEDAGGPAASFIDQWHFSPAFHARLADELDRICRAELEHAIGPDHVSHRFMLGPVAGDIPRTVQVLEGYSDSETKTLSAAPKEDILVYKSEIETINNPRGNDRAEFERQATR